MGSGFLLTAGNNINFYRKTFKTVQGHVFEKINILFYFFLSSSVRSVYCPALCSSRLSLCFLPSEAVFEKKRLKMDMYISALSLLYRLDLSRQKKSRKMGQKTFFISLLSFTI